MITQYIRSYNINIIRKFEKNLIFSDLPRVKLMEMNKRILGYIVLVFFLTSCATFIEEEESNQLKIYEKYIYVLNDDVKINKFSLKKGQNIKIYLKVEEESIKVYGYPSDMGFLKADRVLILYIFNDDFKDSRFDRHLFKKKLFEIITQKK